MKKTLILFLTIFLVFTTYAQEHANYFYNTTVKNESNILIKNQLVNIKLSILKDTYSGDPVYVETQQTKTNEDGYVHLLIGQGAIELGNYSSVDLSKGAYWLQTEIAPTGTNYLTPVVQEMSENEYEYGHIDLNSGNFFKILTRDLFNSWSVRILLILSLGGFLFVKFELWNLFSSKPKRSYRFANSETKTNTNSQIDSNFNIPQSKTNSHIDTTINIPQTSFLQDLISGKNLTNTRSFLLFSLGGILIFFWGKFIFENIDFKGNGIISAIWHLILVILSPIMMIAGPLLLIGSLVNLSSASAEVFYYNRNKRNLIQAAIAEAKQKEEQAIQDEIYRKKQAKYEEEERIRKQKEIDIWNSKSPNERAKIKFKEMEDAIHNLNGNYADGIFREWEAEFEKYIAKSEIISAKDKIFQLRLLDTQEEQRQSEIREAREFQRKIDRENDSRRLEEAKDKRIWYCPKCTSVVPGRYKPDDRNCPAGKYHVWQLRG